MRLQLKHKPFNTHLRVEIKGARTPGSEVRESLEIWKQIAKLCSQLHQTKILAIMKLSGRLPMESAFQIAKSADIIGWSKDFKLAVVAPEPATLVNIQFSEMILLDLGYDIKMFSSPRKAKKWLLAS